MHTNAKRRPGAEYLSIAIFHLLGPLTESTNMD